MNKTELIDQIAHKAGVNRIVAENVVDALVDVVTERLKAGQETKLSTLGRFTMRSLKARRGTNPRTQAEIDIPARNKPFFQFGKVMREALR